MYQLVLSWLLLLVTLDPDKILIRVHLVKLRIHFFFIYRFVPLTCSCDKTKLCTSETLIIGYKYLVLFVAFYTKE